MAAYRSSFESVKSIEERREFKRQTREEIVEKAKEEYEKAERRKELKRARGEDTWMLPDVDLRLKELEEEQSGTGKKKKKKEKKSKKTKKEKKKKDKKERKAKGDDSDDSSADSEDEWVEAEDVPQLGSADKSWKVQKEKSDLAENSAPKQRDEWMTFDFLTMKTVSTTALRAEKEKEKEAEKERVQAIEQAGLHKRELNPYWKDGGSGLPSVESNRESFKKAAIVDDGGLSWLRKSYQRMKEQAERDKRSLDDVVAERYGSMEQFQRRLEAAEKAAFGNSQKGRDREYGRERWRKPGPRDSVRDDPLERGSIRVRGGHHSSYGKEEYEKKALDSRPDREHFKFRNSRPEESDRRSQKPGNESRLRESPRPSRSCEEPSIPQSSSKDTFLKPLEMEDTASANWCSKVERSPAPPPRSSLGFRKPADDDNGISWRKDSRESVLDKTSERQAASDSTSEEDWKARPDQGGAPKSKGSTPQREQKECSLAQITSQERKSQLPSSSASVAPCRTPVKEYKEEEEADHILSEEEMNRIGAKLVKAELMGNTDLACKLKAQLDAARKVKENLAQNNPAASVPRKLETKAAGREEEEVVLFRTDQSGRAWPVNAPTELLEPKGGRRKKQLVETHRDGERVRYFQDDDNVDLQEMVKREKMGTAEDQNVLYSRMASKLMGKTDGDNYTLDDMFVSSAAKKERSGQEEERQRQKAIQEHRRLAGRMEKCHFCFDNPELPKHLIIAIGTKVYLCLPNCKSLAEGHCLIAPLHHHTSATTLDEDIWQETQMFRRALVKMFEDQGQDCVFLETHMNPKKRHHMVYECIPLPREVGDMAPIYFKKAIMESDEEWAMNKKLIDLSSRDVRRAVPKGLPYFSVDFGLQGGYAHVIENEHKFPHYFGKEIIGGMLDLEPRCWRKPFRENFDDQRKKVLQFAQWWKPFDCTKNQD
ncbi:CWF19-like protein 2 isoform X1 [Acipenser ruthenus]|uniref:CWF19-like protein 2 isoform X1 n=1 Tax=Acipenser ruthenus TaxID=7906 RepID=UPI00274105BD|nr:CWF19-like protein 2 isoform X1 [Acipenser ruthenus]